MKNLISILVLLFISISFAQGQQVKPTLTDKICFKRLVDTLVIMNKNQNEISITKNEAVDSKLSYYFERLQPLIKYYGFNLEAVVRSKKTYTANELKACEHPGQIPYKKLATEITTQ